MLELVGAPRAFAHLDDTYGGVADYLVTAGSLPRRTLDDLRSSLLVPSGAG
ncbi:hypothetical protein [Rhodococcus sp. LB1]|uniref:hypothetical protein n=1 Tax=Rhodococcus sp. LB1 TaxID=1807499 RepID=UPI000AD3E30D|nr:hypothetical protein [Rhodococcus sp. LB1]